MPNKIFKVQVQLGDNITMAGAFTSLQDAENFLKFVDGLAVAVATVPPINNAIN